ncbi:hypothetical protein AB0N05_13705 [Nocardia sp. NPDC051030]|uniref:hypothetical protein n=1 Tax=Nocardia sp. NPDC051030 TaxID=3155162 RepID=UPI00343669F9
MHSMDERIAEWSRTAAPDRLRSGPALEDLGGIDEIVCQAEYFTTSPFLGLLVSAAGQRPERVSAALGDLIVTCMAGSTHHLSFAEAADALACSPQLARALSPKITRALLRRVHEAQDAIDNPTVASIGAEAAECLVQLAFAGIATPAQLLGALDAVTEDLDELSEEFAVRLPRLLGVLDAHHPDAGLRQALERCLTRDHTFRDAAFELALSDVRSALRLEGYPAMVERLTAVRQRLRELTTVDADRLDARIYLAGIEGLLGLSAPDAPSRVAAAASTLHENLHRYRAWRMRTRTPAWACGRQSDITAWAELTTLLDAAAKHLGRDDPWYEHGRGILTALSRAYSAHHTVVVLADTPTAGVVETIIAPVVEDAFLERESRIEFLAHALEHDDEIRENPVAQRLYRSLTARLRAPTLAEGEGDAPPGKFRRWPAIARQLEPDDFATLTAQNDDRIMDRLELALRDRDDFLHAASDPKYSRLLTTLIDRLSQSRDWLPGIAEPFQVLVDATVRFACHCYDVGRKMGGSYTEFLRARDKDGKKQKVDEALFHQYYREFLCGTALFRVVKSEVIDLAGGRADILISFPSASFNVECKIEEKDASRQGLHQYVAQTAEYQNTGPSFAILLALDKTIGAEGAVNLFDSIWIEEVQRPDEAEPCLVVIVRVPGGRESPNDLRPASPALRAVGGGIGTSA